MPDKKNLIRIEKGTKLSQIKYQMPLLSRKCEEKEDILFCFGFKKYFFTSTESGNKIAVQEKVHKMDSQFFEIKDDSELDENVSPNQLLDKKRGKFAISTSTPLVTAKEPGQHKYLEDILYKLS